MSRSTPDPSRAQDQPQTSRPGGSGTDAGNAAPPDDSGVGEEDPGAALGDPEVRDAVREEDRSGNQAERSQRGGA